MGIGSRARFSLNMADMYYFLEGELGGLQTQTKRKFRFVGGGPPHLAQGVIGGKSRFGNFRGAVDNIAGLLQVQYSPNINFFEAMLCPPPAKGGAWRTLCFGHTPKWRVVRGYS